MALTRPPAWWGGSYGGLPSAPDVDSDESEARDLAPSILREQRDRLLSQIDDLRERVRQIDLELGRETPRETQTPKSSPTPAQETLRDEGGGEGTTRMVVGTVHGIGAGILGAFGIPKSATDSLGSLEQQAITSGYDRSREEKEE